VFQTTRCNNNLLIYKISSTCFGQYFAHLQEPKTDILQHMVSCCGRRQDTICCKISVLRSWRWAKYCPKHIEL